MIKNSQGQIAIKWMINPNGKTVQIKDLDKYYVFIPKFHVVLAWVDSSDVERLLSLREKTCNCNNGTFKNAFAIASLLDVNLWMTGTRHGEGHEVTWKEVVNDS